MFGLGRVRLRLRRAEEPQALEYYRMGDEVSVETSIVQASHALDLAGEIAAGSGDSVALVTVAEYWTKLADFIMAVSEHKRKQELDEPSDFKTGFQPSSIEDNEEENARGRADEGDDHADHPGSGADGFHPEHGQFRIFANRRGGRGFRAYW